MQTEAAMEGPEGREGELRSTEGSHVKCAFSNMKKNRSRGRACRARPVAAGA